MAVPSSKLTAAVMWACLSPQVRKSGSQLRISRVAFCREFVSTKSRCPQVAPIYQRMTRASPSPHRLRLHARALPAASMLPLGMRSTLRWLSRCTRQQRSCQHRTHTVGPHEDEGVVMFAGSACSCRKNSKAPTAARSAAEAVGQWEKEGSRLEPKRGFSRVDESPRVSRPRRTR